MFNVGDRIHYSFFTCIIVDCDDKYYYLKDKFGNIKQVYRHLVDKYGKLEIQILAKAKDVKTDKYSAYIDCGEYFAQMQIIDCSSEIEIIGQNKSFK